MNRPVGNILNLTLTGKLAAFTCESKSDVARSAASLAARMDCTWTQIWDFGQRIRADTTRSSLDREALLSQFSKKQVDALNPEASKAMIALDNRRAAIEKNLADSLREVDAVSAMRGQEIRGYLRSLNATERADVLKNDPAMAHAAACGPAALSGLTADHYAFLKNEVIQREQPQMVQELADVNAGTDMLKMACTALVQNYATWTNQAVLEGRVEAPTQEA